MIIPQSQIYNQLSHLLTQLNNGRIEIVNNEVISIIPLQGEFATIEENKLIFKTQEGIIDNALTPKVINLYSNKNSHLFSIPISGNDVSIDGDKPRVGASIFVQNLIIRIE